MSEPINIHAGDFYYISRDALKNGSSIRFRAWGQSMSKTIRNGECVEIMPVNPNELNKGDIVFFFSENRPYVHRLIKKISNDNANLFFTKGDRAFCFDAPIKEKDILGKVVAVRRGNQRFGLDRNKTKLERFLNITLSILAPYLLVVPIRLRQLAGNIFRTFLSKKCFRRLLQRVFSLKNISMAIASEEDLDKIYIDFGIQSLPGQGDFWFVSKIKEKLIAAVNLSRDGRKNFSNKIWSLSGLKLKALYRGRGVAKRLCQAAMSEANKRGGSSIRLMVSQKNRAAINLYKGLGFRQVSTDKNGGTVKMIKRI